MPASYRPMVKVDGQFSGNAMRFATYDEARRYADDLMMRWTLVTDTRVDESNDPPIYRITNGVLESL